MTEIKRGNGHIKWAGNMVTPQTLTLHLKRMCFSKSKLRETLKQTRIGLEVNHAVNLVLYIRCVQSVCGTENVVVLCTHNETRITGHLSFVDRDRGVLSQLFHVIW